MKIRKISDVLKEQFGQKILKLSLSSGCSCPNRDGTLGWEGCSFCSEGGSGEFASPFAPLKTQIEEAKKLVNNKFPASMPESQRKYIAYFQSYTNTYGEINYLRELYSKAIMFPEVVIVSIGTRPDCLSEEMIRMLRELNDIKPIWIELGLQTIHDRTAENFGRGYTLASFEDAYRRLKQAGLTVIVHVILGLPGESRSDILETVRYLGNLTPLPDGVKLQLLHVLSGTRLAAEYLERPFHIMTMEEYTDLVVDCLKELPEDIVIHRLTGDAPKKLLIEPKWSADKKKVLNMLSRKILEANRPCL